MIEIITTGDGSHSLFDRELNETYHSTYGAIEESLHVFITNGLREVFKNPGREFHILEIGFGTGLNALLTLKESLEHRQVISYTTIEKYPLENDLIRTLNYPEILNWPEGKIWLERLHAAPWDEQVTLNEYFVFEKKRMDMLALPDLGEGRYDLVYYDAFAPSKQPEMWSTPVLEVVKRSMKPGGLLTTYCARGQFKRDLKSLGFRVDVMPGSCGKREMVRAACP